VEITNSPMKQKICELQTITYDVLHWIKNSTEQMEG